MGMLVFFFKIIFAFRFLNSHLMIILFSEALFDARVLLDFCKSICLVLCVLVFWSYFFV